MRRYEYDIVHTSYSNVDVELTRRGQKGWRPSLMLGRDEDGDPMILIERDTTEDPPVTSEG